MFIHNLGHEITLGIKNLFLHSLRSALTMLGIACGIGSVMAMLAVGEGASKKVLEQIRQLGSHNVIIYSMKPVNATSNRSSESFISIYGLLYEDEAKIRETFDSVENTVASKILIKEGRFANRFMELRVIGTTSGWFEFVKRPLIAGRRLAASDEDNKRNVAVLTETVVRKLLANQNIIGQSIRIGGSRFVVVGVVGQTKGEHEAHALDQSNDVYMPISTMREHFGDIYSQITAGSRISEKVEIHQIIVKIKDIKQVEATAKGVQRMLETFHKNNDYRLQVPLALLRQTQATKRTFNIVLGSIAAISLLVGGIGIMNIMLASVNERTREIGIRRAIGAKKRQIISQFLIETVALSVCGGIVGIGIGFLIPSLITWVTGMPTDVTRLSLVLSLGISMAVGMIFGLYPARRAAMLDPIDALRHE